MGNLLAEDYWQSPSRSVEVPRARTREDKCRCGALVEVTTAPNRRTPVRYQGPPILRLGDRVVNPDGGLGRCRHG
jgi:hypothetical protein